MNMVVFDDHVPEVATHEVKGIARSLDAANVRDHEGLRTGLRYRAGDPRYSVVAQGRDCPDSLIAKEFS